MTRVKLSYSGHMMQRYISLEKCIILGKVEEKRISTSKVFCSITVMVTALLEDLKDQVMDRSSWKTSMRLPRVNTTLSVHNQSVELVVPVPFHASYLILISSTP